MVQGVPGKEELLESSYEEQHSRREERGVTVSLLCLLALLPGTLCGMLLLAFLMSAPSQDITRNHADTTDGNEVPKVPMSDVGLPPSADVDKRGPLGTADPIATTPAKPPRRLVPSQGELPRVCSSSICRYVSQWMRSHIDTTKNPCEDFYGYVCGTYQGKSRWDDVAAEKEQSLIRFLNATTVPPSNQNAPQKAAGIYKACLSFVEGRKTETHFLVLWMISLGLDFNNESALAKVDPVEMIVRSSLDLGVPAILSIRLHPITIHQGRRRMMIFFSSEESEWLDERLVLSDTVNIDHYLLLLHWFGLEDPRDNELAAHLLGLEKELLSIVEENIIPRGRGSLMAIRDFGTYTSPYVTSEQWESYISGYTNGTYREEHLVYLAPRVLNLIWSLLNADYVGKKGLQYLVAWSIYKRLVDSTVPGLLLGDDSPSDACFQHVGKAMHLALTSPYFQDAVKPETLQVLNTMFSNIRDVYRNSFETSSWVKGNDRNVVLGKLANLTPLIGSPGRYLERSYVDEVYKNLPDAPPDRIFPTWIKAISLSAHHKWADQTTHVYNETLVNAFYAAELNSVIIPSGIIRRPFYYDGGPAALNYGSIGRSMGHEIMHAYDLRSIKRDDRGIIIPWASDEFKREYNKRGLCLRRSHTAAVRRRQRQEVLKDDLDSENLADLAGASAAYRAFALLPLDQRRQTLVGLNVSADRLFFVSYCTPLCAEPGLRSIRYAPYRSRCIVPLMNLPQFSDAFGCTPGQLMNPANKCSFWA